MIYFGSGSAKKPRRQYSSKAHEHSDLKPLRWYVKLAWYRTGLRPRVRIDALFLESEMVKRYKPRYNVLLRDDKPGWMFAWIDMKSEWLYVCFTRNRLDDGPNTFGPFYNGYAEKSDVTFADPSYYLTKLQGGRMSMTLRRFGPSPKQRGWIWSLQTKLA